MRLAIWKYPPDAQDLVMILEILKTLIQGGTETEVEALLKSVTMNMKIPTREADSPPYPRLSHDLLRRILSYIEPKITFIDSLEPLRGALEPFMKAQVLKEKTGASKESPAELRKRQKQLDEQASLSVGLYRLEEVRGACDLA
ncbi:hypothetical protein OG21DRAFT_1131122 [Imleria badia]|nr:hypothetical protein OG21DRAFT_1131122 [Imleria badia]